MTREEMDFIGSMNMCDEISNEAYKKIMAHCEEQQPCEDCISRESVMVRVKEYFDNPSYDEKMLYEELVNLPSVTPQPKIGRWEWVQYDSNPNIGNWHCSECRTIIPYMPEETDNTPIYKWCPMCGARMEVAE